MADRDDLLLPGGTHLIHIGPQKTGSTAIQAALHAKRDEVLEHGVVYPGPTMRPAEAASAGLGFPTPRGAPAARREAWDDLLRQVREAGGRRICISHEAFGRATDLQAQRVVSELGGGRPHILAVARRYDSLLPSQWQQRVKAGEHLAYHDWLKVVLDDGQSARAEWRNLWVPHDTRRLVERWAGLVGPENFTLVVSDDNDRALLPRTFEALLGLPDGMLQVVPDKTNRSLSFNEVELLRRVNLLFHEQGWGDRDYYYLVYRGLIRRMVKSPMPEGDTAIPSLPDWAAERVAELSRQRVESLRESGIRVLGELDRLAPEPAARPSDAAEVTQISLESALRALEGMAVGARHMRWDLRDRHAVQRRRAVKRARRSARATAPPPQPPPPPTLRSRVRSRAGRLLRRVRPTG